MVGLLNKLLSATGLATVNPENLGTEYIPTPVPYGEVRASQIYAIKFAHMSNFLANGGTRPRASTVRRALRLEAAGKPLNRGARIVLPNGTTKHPTKRR